MKQLWVKTQISKYEKIDDFLNEFVPNERDLILTHGFIKDMKFSESNLKCDFLFQEDFGTGEPSTTLIDKIWEHIDAKGYKRIFAIGGGAIIDVAKVLILKKTGKTVDLYDGTAEIIKEKELVVIPTTCGTGSEVTNICISEVVEKGTKAGLANDLLYPDHAVLIPELIESLPYKFFMYSSVDALIHAIESYVSPKANSFTEALGENAIRTILKGYKEMLEKGENERLNHLGEFLEASTMAGIAFGNAGVGAVHALSYPVGGNYHVPHGEVNYQFFTEVFKVYKFKKPNGKIRKVEQIIADTLDVSRTGLVFEKLDMLLNQLIEKKTLKEYGMKKEEIELFADSVIEKQQRLLANNYVALSRDEIRDVFNSLY